MSDVLGDDDVMIDVAGATASSGIGIVRDAGERARVLLGKQVLFGPLDPCGECDVCRRGGAAVCPLARRRDAIGAHVVAAARWVVTLGDGLELPVPAGAAVAGDVATAYTMYARTGIGPRELAVVLGFSPVARFLVEILLAKSVTPAVVAEPDRGGWCDWLLSRGAVVARVARGASDADARQTVAATLAALEGAPTNRPWRVLATTGDAVPRAAALAGPRATLTVLAPSPPLPGDLAAREVTVIGVAGAHPDLVVEAAAMCVKREVDLAAGTTQEDRPDSACSRVVVPR